MTVGYDHTDMLSSFGHLQGQALLEEMITNVFGDRLALVSSFGAHSAILLHMVAQIDRNMNVVFLDTGKLFPETLRYQEKLVEQLGLTNLVAWSPDKEDLERDDPSGDLWSTDTDQCCFIRKVLPLNRALKGFDAWITGRKRYQGGSRVDLESLEVVDGMTKINPLAYWSREQVTDYFSENELDYHPLYEHGYLSLGCQPCTRAVGDGADERSGRWTEKGKTECGIHSLSLRKSDY
ncbi:MAG: phosphoadenylyl-sulfate reductase [Pseudomonadota bacterium]